MVCKLSSWFVLLFDLCTLFEKTLVQPYRFTVGGSWLAVKFLCVCSYECIRIFIRICEPLTVNHEPIPVGL